MSGQPHSTSHPLPEVPISKESSLQTLAHLVHLIVIGFLLEYILFEGLPISLLFRVLSMGVILIAFVRSNGVLLLILIQGSLFLQEPSRPLLVHGISTFLYCFASLALIVYACSYRNLGARVNRYLVGLFASVSDRPIDTDPLHASDRRTGGIGVASGIALTLILVLLAGMIAFRILPISESVKSEWYQKSLAIGGYVWPGPTVLTLVIALLIGLSEFAWRVLTPAQARLYMRSTFIRYHYRDLRMIIFRDLKLRRKRIPPVIAQPKSTESQ